MVESTAQIEAVEISEKPEAEAAAPDDRYEDTDPNPRTDYEQETDILRLVFSEWMSANEQYERIFGEDQADKEKVVRLEWVRDAMLPEFPQDDSLVQMSRERIVSDIKTVKARIEARDIERAYREVWRRTTLLERQRERVKGMKKGDAAPGADDAGKAEGSDKT